MVFHTSHSMSVIQLHAAVCLLREPLVLDANTKFPFHRYIEHSLADIERKIMFNALGRGRQFVYK